MPRVRLIISCPPLARSCSYRNRVWDLGQARNGIIEGCPGSGTDNRVLGNTTITGRMWEGTPGRLRGKGTPEVPRRLLSFSPLLPCLATNHVDANPWGGGMPIS